MVNNFRLFPDQQQKKLRLQELTRMITESMVAIDDSIEKINLKLNPNNPVDVRAQSWNAEEKMKIYTMVYTILSSNEVKGSLSFAIDEYYDKFGRTLRQRISKYVIPSLENHKFGEELLFMSEVAKQWTQMDEYRRNLHIIFLHPEKMVRESLGIFKPLLVDICKANFCDMVWDKFHNEIDLSVTKMMESGVFDNESNNIPLKEEMVKFLNEMKKVSNKKLKKTLNIVKLE
ncbi:uncharacterized protein LOC115713841 isoform X1 [Cannabis sativa]|uniref:uncharacterized protein LOC115713841 isoform X1 n=1 Tax=Cannabis sativa TaxID=3483 RepID=UPI0029CA9992|nr:uncharacterized protein LOC115713841 isoform X1 [Cannabis sativa]XP_060970905.1 uncharacterized protein LOC115713841 isoform X1 [Cannabis sativa]